VGGRSLSKIEWAGLTTELRDTEGASGTAMELAQIEDIIFVAGLKSAAPPLDNKLWSSHIDLMTYMAITGGRADLSASVDLWHEQHPETPVAKGGVTIAGFVSKVETDLQTELEVEVAKNLGAVREEYTRLALDVETAMEAGDGKAVAEASTQLQVFLDKQHLLGYECGAHFGEGSADPYWVGVANDCDLQGVGDVEGGGEGDEGEAEGDEEGEGGKRGTRAMMATQQHLMTSHGK
jgi:hypothetical protein